MQNIFDKFVLLKFAAQHGVQNENAPAYTRAQAMGSDWLLDQIERANLEGKGGARFPTHKKMRLHRLQETPVKHLVVNGAEHEPGSFKDNWLQTHHPSAVVDGALCIAFGVGATHVHFAINEINHEAIEAMRMVVGNLRRTRKDFPTLLVHTIPDVYVAGEETALIRVLEGHPPMPSGRPPFPIESGLHTAPTLVHNAETVAHVPYIVLSDADTYRQLGRNGLGPTLCTFGKEFVQDGVRLVPQGITINELIDEYGGGLHSQQAVVAIQPGGPSSAYLSSTDFACAFDVKSLMAQGSSLGCAAIRGYADAADLIDAVREITDFFAISSCGQCPPCGMQTRMLSTIMKQIAAGKASRPLIDQVSLITKANQGKGLCGLIRMPVAPIESLLHRFPGVVSGRQA